MAKSGGLSAGGRFPWFPRPTPPLPATKGLRGILSFFFRPLPPACAEGMAIFLVATIVYLATRDGRFSFDALIYAGTIRNPLGVYPWRIVLEWNHPLWYPATKFFWRGLSFFLPSITSYTSNQIFNALAGAVGLVLLHRLLAPRVGWKRSFLWVGLTGVSHAYWSSATGGENYLLGGVFVLAFALVWDGYRRGPSLLRAVLLLVSALVAAYVHIANALCGIIALAVLWRHGPRTFRWRRLFGGVVFGALGAAPYLVVHDLGSFEGLRRWWAWGVGMGNGVAPGSSVAGQFILNPLWNLTVGLTTLWKSVFFFQRLNAAAVSTTLAVLVAAGLALGGPSPDRDPREKAMGGAFLLFFVYFVFYSLWQPGNIVYWVTPLILAVGGGAPRFAFGPLSRGVRWAGAVAAVGLLALHNFSGKIVGDLLGDDTAPFVAVARQVGAATPPGSCIVISGVRWPLLKSYLPFFAERNRIALQLEVINARDQKVKPVDLIAYRLWTELENRRPIYLLEEALGPEGDFGAWGLPAEEMEPLWKHFELKPVEVLFAPGGGTRLFLLWPRWPDEKLREALRNRLDEFGLGHQYRRSAERPRSGVSARRSSTNP